MYQPGHWKECEPLAKLSARTREFPSETTTLDSDLVISSDSHRIWRRARSFRSFQASRWRPRPPAYGQGGGAACVMPLRNETYQLQDREAQNSEHQMAHHFVRPAHPYGAAAVVVLEPAIDPFGRAAFTVTNLFRHAMPNTA